MEMAKGGAVARRHFAKRYVAPAHVRDDGRRSDVLVVGNPAQGG